MKSYFFADFCIVDSEKFSVKKRKYTWIFKPY